MSFRDMVFTNAERGQLQFIDHMSDSAVYRTVRDMQTRKLNFDYVSGAWEKLTGVSVEHTLADRQNIFVNIPLND